MERINKNDIVDYVAEEAYLSRRDALAALESIFEIISDALVAGDEVDIPNFGAFIVKERKQKMITHPGTGKKELFDVHPAVDIRLSKRLKERLNGK